MGTKVVTVRALPRAGFMAFYRGGHRWPSAMPGRTVRVTEELLAVLRTEEYLAVSEPVGEPEDKTLEYIDNRNDNRAHNAAAGARVEAERLKAEKAALELVEQNETLRREVEELRAKLAAKASASKPSKADKQ
jgi:hypothetical protein